MLEKLSKRLVPYGRAHPRLRWPILGLLMLAWCLDCAWAFVRALGRELRKVGREAAAYLRETGLTPQGSHDNAERLLDAGIRAAKKLPGLWNQGRQVILPLVYTKGRAVWNTARQWCLAQIRAVKVAVPVYYAQVKTLVKRAGCGVAGVARRSADKLRADLPQYRRHAPRRAMAAALALVLCLGMLPVSAFAAEWQSTCPHDLGQHDETCGYIAAVEGTPCTHTEHTDCGYVEAAAETPCTCGAVADADGNIVHVDGCAHAPATEGVPCPHQQDSHDASCGFAEAVAETSCEHEHNDTCGGLPPVVEPPQEPDCTCNAAPDAEGSTIHAEDCPLYVAPERPEEPVVPHCTCGAVPDAEGVTVHTEGCPLYTAPACTCGATPDAEGNTIHAANCPLFTAPEQPQPPALTEISSLEGAPEAAQTAMEGSLDALNLPNTLTGVYEGGTVDVPVTWDGLPTPAAKGDYPLTARLTLPEGYALAEGMNAPAVALTLTPDPAVEAVRALIAALPTPEAIRTMTEEEREESGAYDKMDAAYNAYDALTDAQKALLPGAQGVFDALLAALQSPPVTMAAAADISWYGNGTATEFTIDSAAKLLGLAQLVNGEAAGTASVTFEGKTIKLTKDINLATVCGEGLGDWVPIGKDAAHPFKGAVVGATGNTYAYIYNLYINATEPGYYGLFGYVDWTGASETTQLKAIAFLPANIAVTATTGDVYVGALAGYIAGSASGMGTLDKCSLDTSSQVSGSATGEATSGAAYVGSLVGAITGSLTLKSAMSMEQNAITATGGSAYAGGILGAVLDGGSLSLATSGLNEAAVTGDFAGGLVGAMLGDGAARNLSVAGFTNAGAITGASAAGGMAGDLAGCTVTTTQGTLKNSGAISGDDVAGGLVGRAGNISLHNAMNAATVTSTSGTAGGIVGIMTDGAVLNSYVTSASIVTGATAGGIVGNASGGRIAGCYLPIALKGTKILGIGTEQVTLDHCFVGASAADETAADYFVGSGSPTITGCKTYTGYVSLLSQLSSWQWTENSTAYLRWLQGDYPYAPVFGTQYFTSSRELDFLYSPGDRSGAGWTWVESTKTLTLQNCNLTLDTIAGHDNAINSPDYVLGLPAKAKLVLEGTNTITATATPTRYTATVVYGASESGSEANLTIKGTGSLAIVNQMSADVLTTNAGLQCSSLAISEGDVTVTMPTAEAATVTSSRGVSATELTMSGGSITATGGAVTAAKGVSVGVNAAPKLSGGRISGTGGAAPTDGKSIGLQFYDLAMNGGQLKGSSAAAGESYALNATGALVFTGGDTQLECKNEAVASATNCSITGTSPTLGSNMAKTGAATEKSCRIYDPSMVVGTVTRTTPLNFTKSITYTAMDGTVKTVAAVDVGMGYGTAINQNITDTAEGWAYYYDAATPGTNGTPPAVGLTLNGLDLDLTGNSSTGIVFPSVGRSLTRATITLQKDSESQVTLDSSFLIRTADSSDGYDQKLIIRGSGAGSVLNVTAGGTGSDGAGLFYCWGRLTPVLQSCTVNLTGSTTGGYLNGNVSNLTLGAGATLHLSGKLTSRGNVTLGGVGAVLEGGSEADTLVLWDTTLKADTGTLQNLTVDGDAAKLSKQPLMIHGMDEKGTGVTLKSVTFQNRKLDRKGPLNRDDHPAVITVYRSLTMDETVTVKHCESMYGAIVCAVHPDSQLLNDADIGGPAPVLTLKGAHIVENRGLAIVRGGWRYYVNGKSWSDPGDVKLESGEIARNVAMVSYADETAVVDMHEGAFTMTGGTISDNYAFNASSYGTGYNYNVTHSASALRLRPGSTGSIRGGKITGNRAETQSAFPSGKEDGKPPVQRDGAVVVQQGNSKDVMLTVSGDAYIYNNYTASGASAKYTNSYPTTGAFASGEQCNVLLVDNRSKDTENTNLNYALCSRVVVGGALGAEAKIGITPTFTYGYVQYYSDWTPADDGPNYAKSYVCGDPRIGSSYNMTSSDAKKFEVQYPGDNERYDRAGFKFDSSKKLLMLDKAWVVKFDNYYYSGTYGRDAIVVTQGQYAFPGADHTVVLTPNAALGYSLPLNIKSIMEVGTYYPTNPATVVKELKAGTDYTIDNEAGTLTIKASVLTSLLNTTAFGEGHIIVNATPTSTEAQWKATGESAYSYGTFADGWAAVKDKGGTIKAREDVTLTAPLEVTSAITLSGPIVYGATDGETPLFTVKSGGDLTLSAVQLTDQSSNDDTAMISVESGGTLRAKDTSKLLGRNDSSVPPVISNAGAVYLEAVTFSNSHAVENLSGGKVYLSGSNTYPKLGPKGILVCEENSVIANDGKASPTYLSTTVFSGKIAWKGSEALGAGKTLVTGVKDAAIGATFALVDDTKNWQLVYEAGADGGPNTMRTASTITVPVIIVKGAVQYGVTLAAKTAPTMPKVERKNLEEEAIKQGLTIFTHTSVPPTSEGWQYRAKDAAEDAWEEFIPTAESIRYSMNGGSLRYWAANSQGTGYSAALPLTVNQISGGAEEPVWPTASLVFGDKLSDVTLTGGSGAGDFTWKFPDSMVSSVGSISYSVIFTPTDTDYRPVTETLSFPVAPKPITITGVRATSRAYNGTTAVTGFSGGAISGLVSGYNVTLAYTGATGAMADAAVGTGKAVTISGVTLTGGYSSYYSIESATGTVDITALTVDPANPPAALSVTVSDQTFTGQPCTPDPVVKLGDTTLVKEVDYTLAHTNNTAVADKNGSNPPTVTITFMGDNLSGSATATFSIVDSPLEEEQLSEVLGVTAAELMQWHNENIALTAQNGWTLSADAVNYGSTLTLSTESTKVNGEIVPSTGKFYAQDSAGNIYLATVTYKLDKTAPTVTVEDEKDGEVVGSWGPSREIKFTVEDELSGVVFVQYAGSNESLQAPTKNEDGSYTFTARVSDQYTIMANDAAENQTEHPFITQQLDGVQPTAAFGAITGTAGQNGWFTGTVTVNVNVTDPETIFNDESTPAINESNKSGIAKWEYSLDGGTNWTEMAKEATSFTIGTDGDYTDKLQVRATDNAGNVSEIATASAKLDTVTPVLTPTVTAGGESYSGAATAHDVVVTLSTNTVNLSNVSYSYQEGKLEGEDWTPKDGANWTPLDGSGFTVNFNCNTQFAFKAVSGAGLESTPAIVTIVRSALSDDDLAETEYGENDLAIDKIPGKDGWYTEKPTITVNPKDTVGVDGLDATSYYELYKSPDTSGAKTELTDPWTIAPTEDGIWSLKIWTEDAAGNQTNAYEIILKVDTTDPTITGVTGNPTAWQNTAAAITFTAADATSGVKSVVVTHADGQSVTYTNDGFAADRNGEYTITVTDNAGYTTTATVTVTHIEKTAPVISDVTLSGAEGTNGWYTTDVTVTVTATDEGGSALAADAYSFDGGATWQSGRSNIYSTNATHTVTVWVRDTAGNITKRAAVEVKLDKEMPTAPTVTATAGGEGYVSGTFTGKDVVFALSGTATASGNVKYQVSTDAGATWSDVTGDTLTHSTNTDDAGVTYRFRAVSTAGLEGTASRDTTVKRRALDDSVLTDLDNAYQPDDLNPGQQPGVEPGQPGDLDFPFAPYWWPENPTITVPEIPYIKDPSGPVIPGTDPAINGYAATTYYKLWREGTDIEPRKAELQAPFAIKPNADGIWTLELWTEDSVGSETAHLVQKIQVDTTAPTVTDVTGNATAWQKTDVTLTVNGAADATAGLADLAYSFDGGATWQAANAKTFAANTTVTVWVRDKAGHSYKHAPIAIDKIDKTAPVVSWDTATAALDSNKWYGATTIAATATDDSGEALRVTYRANGIEKPGGKLEKSGIFTVTATATDPAGNTSTLEKTVRVETAIDDFIAMVDSLNSDSGYQDILDVSNWYNSQNTTIKDRFSKSDDATAANEKLMGLLRDKAEEAASSVTDAIENADTVEEIEQVAKDYDALPDSAKDKIPDEIKKELEQKKKDAEAAQKVIDQLSGADRDKGATASKDPGGSVDEKEAAQDAYDKLTDDQKALVNKDSNAVEDKRHIDTDLAAIDHVLDLLNDIKTPYTPATKDQIKTAQDAYDTLTDKQKDAFPKADKAKLDALEVMRQHAQNVEAKITALGENPSPTDLNAAKGAYNALTADEKAMVDGTLKAELDKKYQDALDQMTADEKAAAEFAAKVEEVKNAPTVEKIEQLIKEHDALSDAAKDKLTEGTKDDYQKLVDDLGKAKPVIKDLDSIDVGKLTPQDMDKVKDILDRYDDLTEDQKELVDVATKGKPGILDEAVKGVEDVTDKIESIPDHIDDSSTTTPDGETVPDLGDCGNAGNSNSDNTGSGGHTYDDHRKAIEDAKIAYEKLTDAGRKLISDAAKERLNREYAALMAYLEYSNTAKTATTNVEIAGLAEKVALPAESATAAKTVISVVMKDEKPSIMPPLPAGKSEALSVDIKLVASIYDDSAEDAAPTATETVQPKSGESVLVKLRLPTGYELDTLEIWHVKDSGARNRVADFWLVTESDGTYAVFEVSSFSHFVFYAEKTPSGGGNDGDWMPPAPKPDIADSDHGSTTVTPQQPRPGDKVTVTPKPDEGYVVDQVIVTDQNGKDIPVKDNGDGTYSYTQPNGKVTITVTFKPAPKDTALPFTDVSESDWFYESVKCVYEKGLMVGTSDSKFSPYLTTSRGMIVTILWRLEGEPTATGANPFADVTADKYYAAAIAWGAENGIVKGYGNGNFGPNDPITREQMAAMLYRYTQFKGHDVTAAGDLSKFTDQPSAWAIDAMQWAVGAGVLNGKGNGTLAPEGQATRAEAAAMLTRYLSE